MSKTASASVQGCELINPPDDRLSTYTEGLNEINWHKAQYLEIENLVYRLKCLYQLRPIERMRCILSQEDDTELFWCKWIYHDHDFLRTSFFDVLGDRINWSIHKSLRRCALIYRGWMLLTHREASGLSVSRLCVPFSSSTTYGCWVIALLVPPGVSQYLDQKSVDLHMNRVWKISFSVL